MSLTVIIVLFVVAALGGFVLASFHFRNKPAPKALIVVHALVAAIALVGLILYAARQ